MYTHAHLGRLYQVEYAMEAIEHAGTCLGILASDGVLLATEKKNTNKLLDEIMFSEKIYRLSTTSNACPLLVLSTLYDGICVLLLSLSNMACSVAGITSDANVLTNQLRLIAQR